MFVVGGMLLIASLFMGACASKHLEYSSIDAKGNPFTVRADIGYLFVDQKTNGFEATIPNAMFIKFGSQDSQAKTAFLTEMLKAYNSIP